MEPRKFASHGAANFLQRSPLSDLDGSGMRSATQQVPLAFGRLLPALCYSARKTGRGMGPIHTVTR